MFSKVFFFGIWQPKYYDEYETKFSFMDLKIFWIGESQIVIFYLTYFIFSIIFYSTLTLFICLKKSINLGLFCLFGLIYIVIASVVLFSIKKDVLIFVFDLILFILEIFFYNRIKIIIL